MRAVAHEQHAVVESELRTDEGAGHAANIGLQGLRIQGNWGDRKKKRQRK